MGSPLPLPLPYQSEAGYNFMKVKRPLSIKTKIAFNYSISFTILCTNERCPIQGICPRCMINTFRHVVTCNKSTRVLGYPVLELLHEVVLHKRPIN